MQEETPPSPAEDICRSMTDIFRQVRIDETRREVGKNRQIEALRSALAGMLDIFSGSTDQVDIDAAIDAAELALNGPQLIG